MCGHDGVWFGGKCGRGDAARGVRLCDQAFGSRSGRDSPPESGTNITGGAGESEFAGTVRPIVRVGSNLGPLGGHGESIGSCPTGGGFQGERTVGGGKWDGKGVGGAVHCAALSPQLLESELFGHEKGSFTGATERRVGRFEQANGGTIFLDEIGEIDLATQVKLLRVLGERSLERVGGNQLIEVDVRLLVATHRSLEKMVREGKFREDLYFRIRVVQIDLPPLRDRPEDIPVLAEAFRREYGQENGKPGVAFSPASMDCLRGYRWPGNVRELRTAVEHGVVLARGSVIEPEDLPSAVRGDGVERAGKGGGSISNLEKVERSAIQEAYKKSGKNVSAAARELGISRRTLQRKLAVLGKKGKVRP